MRATHKFIKSGGYLLISILLFQVLGCSSREEKLYIQAQENAKVGNFREAVDNFDKATVLSSNTEIGLKSAREGSKISFYEIKDFNKAVKFYRIIILSSQDPDERILAQKQIVSIYFDHLSDYQNAVLELNKLIPMLSNLSEQTDYKIKLARAYYYQNNFIQAENEVDEFLSKNIAADLKFDMYLLKGNINMAQKNLLKAIDIFKKMLSEFPEKSLKENIGLTLSVCYEELKDFKDAIDTLEQIKPHHPTPEYIDIRINRLRDRMKNQPGARGKYRK